MGVPTSAVGYTAAMSKREDHEVHKDTWWGHWTKSKRFHYLIHKSPKLFCILSQINPSLPMQFCIYLLFIDCNLAFCLGCVFLPIHVIFNLSHHPVYMLLFLSDSNTWPTYCHCRWLAVERHWTGVNSSGMMFVETVTKINQLTSIFSVLAFESR